MHPERGRWCVDVWRGPSPFELAPLRDGPCLTAADVDDADAFFVADPFMLQAEGLWHMFYEVLETSGRGSIGHAVSEDALTWTHDRIVLREPYHLSYPFVFAADGAYWMTPETLGAEAVGLYRARSFPYDWVRVADLVPGRAADPTPVHHDGAWWLFVCATPTSHESLTLYRADDLLGPWQPHPANPIVGCDHAIARPAGRPFVVGERLFRLAQDCSGDYGKRVHAFEVVELSETVYAERPAGRVIGPGASAWNAAGMHHVDAHQLPGGDWIACVDGRER